MGKTKSWRKKSDIVASITHKHNAKDSFETEFKSFMIK